MAGHALTAASTLQCPHGGQVTASPANSRVKSDSFLLAQADTFTVAGCAFTLPNGQPSPCLKVTWVVADLRVKAGSPTLSETDTGLCVNAQSIPQGPVTVANTQQRVKVQ